MTKGSIVAAMLAAALAAAPACAGAAATEAQARAYIHGAFMTHAAPGIVAPRFTLGPGLAKLLALPAGADNEAAYVALMALTDNKPLAVRRATPEEIVGFGTPPGFDPRHSLYLVEAGDVKLFVLYDLQANNAPYVGLPQDARPQPPAPVATPAPTQPGFDVVWTGFFDYNRSVLNDETRTRLDGEVVAKLVKTAEIRSIQVNGYADLIGRDDYNRKLSEKRAEAVRAYLVAKGVDPKKIEVHAYGRSQQVKTCEEERQRPALIQCLAPNRRVVVEVQEIRK
jgi:OmpA-OmpF porin, OOP family